MAQNHRPQQPGTSLFLRIIVLAYVIYLGINVIMQYGTEEALSLPLTILFSALLIIPAAALLVLTLRQMMTRQTTEELEEFKEEEDQHPEQ